MNRVDFDGFLGLHNYQLAWKGPWARSDKVKRYPDQLEFDTYRTLSHQCDVVIFLVFNDFTHGESNGHKYSGFSKGGPCEQAEKKGYAVVVDQGFKGKIWMGPQILAHHLLLMLTSDIYPVDDPRKYCDNPKSLLHKFIKAGEQSVGQCIVNKLNYSDISLRACMLD